MSKKTCDICGNSIGNIEYMVREMQFGTRDEFRYVECKQCGCLGLIDKPVNFSRYYPSNYGPFLKIKNKKKFKWKLKFALKSAWKRAYVTKSKSMVSRLLLIMLGKPIFPEWINITGITANSKILDIGCGDGGLLFSLREIGFKNLTGIDPHMNFPVGRKGNIEFIKGGVDDIKMEEKYDLVMMHHSLEHMDKHENILRKICGALKNDVGNVVIRIPIKSSYIWSKYREHWFHLDAPRHIFLHTEKSFKLVIDRSGLEIVGMYYDSTPQSLWGSEQYKRDISLIESKSLRNGIDNSMFTLSDVSYFKAKAKELNIKRKGDEVCFVLKRRVDVMVDSACA